MKHIDKLVKSIKRTFPTLEDVREGLRKASVEELEYMVSALEEEQKAFVEIISKEEKKSEDLKNRVEKVELKRSVILDKLNSLPKEDHSFTGANGEKAVRGYQHHPLEYKLSEVELKVLERYDNLTNKLRFSEGRVEHFKNLDIMFSELLGLVNNIIHNPNYELAKTSNGDKNKMPDPLGLTKPPANSLNFSEIFNKVR